MREMLVCINSIEVGSLVDVDASSNTGIATVQIDALTVKDEGSTVGTGVVLLQSTLLVQELMVQFQVILQLSHHAGGATKMISLL